jgi:acetyl-CoA carboxylase biotin carboxyl carrier protein
VPPPGSNGAGHPGANGHDHPGTLKAPLVGIAYLAAEPGSPPYVKVGDTVAEGQTLMIIEAMKVMNQIRAPRAGRISHVYIGDAEPVEYGTALMLIE